MLDLVRSRVGVNDLISIVLKAHTLIFFITSFAWHVHVDYYNNVVKGRAFAKNKETFAFFYFLNIAIGSMVCWGLHINSYDRIFLNFFSTIADQQKMFFQRHEGDLVGTNLPVNYHHNVRTRL